MPFVNCCQFMYVVDFLCALYLFFTLALIWSTTTQPMFLCFTTQTYVLSDYNSATITVHLNEPFPLTWAILFRIYLQLTEILESKSGNITTSTHPSCFLCLTICERIAYAVYSLSHTHFLTMSHAHSPVYRSFNARALGFQHDI